VLGGCGGRAEVAITPRPAASAGPAVATSGAVAIARGQLSRALGEVGLQLGDAQVPFRAPEPPALDTVPRAIVQALLPDDPNHGYITIYEFPTTAAASQGAGALVDYLGTGFGRAQFPPDARHRIRLLGTTLIYYSWSPASSPDVRTEEIEKALDAVGSEVDLPG
jgi:hypothetical protein